MNPMRDMCISSVHGKLSFGDRNVKLTNGLKKCLTDSGMFCCRFCYSYHMKLIVNWFELRFDELSIVVPTTFFSGVSHSINIIMRRVNVFL